MSRIRPSQLRTYLLTGSVAAVILVGGALAYWWYLPAKAVGTQAAESPAASAQPTEAALVPAAASDRPAVANNSDVCHQTDWPKATNKDFLAINCVGKGIAAYDKRLEYVYSLEQVKNWAGVERDDPRLQDCAGLQECEQRAQSAYTPRPQPLPRQPDKAISLAREKEATPAKDKVETSAKAANWATASCESVTQSWESEDPRLSTATCDGLGLVACSHIKRCLGLHDINLGPGSSKIEP